MRGLWRTSLSLSLGLLVSRAYAGDVEWHPVAPPRPAATAQVTQSLSVAGPAVSLGQPVSLTQPTPAVPAAGRAPLAALERPVPLTAPPTPQLLPPAVVDPQVQPVSFVGLSRDPMGMTARAKVDEVAKPLPLGPTAGGEPEFAAPAPKEVLKPEARKPLAPKVIATTPVPPECAGDCTPCPGAVDCCPPCTTVECAPICCEEAKHCCWLCNDGCFPASRFYVRGEYLAWWTKGDLVPPLVSTGQQPPGMSLVPPGSVGSPGFAVLFGGSDIGQEVHSGGRLTAGYWFGDEQWLGIEGSVFYLGNHTTNFNAASTGSPLLARPFMDAQSMQNSSLLQANLPFVDATGMFIPGQIGSDSVSFTSRLWGAEANLRTNIFKGCCYHVGFLGGFRYLGLDEGLSITETEIPFAVPPAEQGQTFAFALLNDRFSTRNRFYGAQLGIDGEYRWRNWIFSGRGKVALGTTHETSDINGSTLFTSQMGITTIVPNSGLLAQPTNVGRAKHSSFAAVPEVGIKIGYQFTDHLRATVGYDFLYWSRVVRPGQQIDTLVNTNQLLGQGGASVVPANPARIFRETDYWAQGFNLGLEFNF